MDKKYLTVGTDKILESRFLPIKDREGAVKPDGGLWLTDYNSDVYNEWLDFLLYVDYEHRWLRWKDCGLGTIFRQPCSIVTLKPDVRIYCLNNKKAFEYLKMNYSYYDFFSYEGLSQDYDGIYIDKNVIDEVAFAVNSTLLFHFDSISCQCPGEVNIEHFGGRVGDYTIVPKKVLKR